MPDPFEIIVGTYEQYLLGYKVNNIVNEYRMDKTFATHSHANSIRSVASNKHYLASGGADDSICLYDLRYRVESGKLVHHNDTVNCIAFTPEASHLFTCSNDGSIAAIRCGNWQMEKHWQKPHKGLAVNTLAIHPTGKIALSTGADGILRTWNLVKGRQAYATNLVPRLKLDAKNVNVLKWSPNGEKYLLAVNQRIDVYSVELAGIDNEIKFDSKIVCVEFLKDDLIAVGLENGQIKFYDLEKSVQTVEAIAHDIRVKCMAFKDDFLVTASSSGEIKLWRYSKHKLDMLQTVNCGARITCLSLAMSYKDLANDKEARTMEEQEEQEVPKKRKFSLWRDVVIEKEDNWIVTSIDASRPKSSERKSKKKRNIEEVQASDVPNRKKNKSILKKKKREDDIILELIPKKRSKLLNNDNCDGDANSDGNGDSNRNGYGNGNGDRDDKHESDSLNRKRKKDLTQSTISEESNNVKLIRLKKNDKIPFKKRKKESVVEEIGGVNLKKKKKKQ